MARTGSPELSRAGGRTGLVVVTLRGDPDNHDSHAAQVQRFVSNWPHTSTASHSTRPAAGRQTTRSTSLVNNGLHRAELISLPITL